MRTSLFRLPATLGLALCFACGGGGDDATGQLANNINGVPATSASGSQSNNGTALTAVASGDPVCLDANSAAVSVQVAVTTSGSVDSAVVTRSIGGGAETTVATIQPQDFVFSGRYKTAVLTDKLTVSNGTTDVTYCFTQSGAQGRESKKTCTTFSVTVDCIATAESCDKVDLLFGNLVNNPVLCNGNGPPAIPVHFRGKATGAVSLTITGPQGFGLSAAMAKSGDSCIYQYLWDLRSAGNGGAGGYHFAVNDESGALASADRALVCR